MWGSTATTLFHLPTGTLTTQRNFVAIHIMYAELGSSKPCLEPLPPFRMI